MKKKLILIILLLLSITINVSAQKVSKDDIPTLSYVVGSYLYTRDPIIEDTFPGDYDGALRTRFLMLGSSSIDSEELDDMIIYYKNPDGVWMNSATNRKLTNVPDKFDISYVNTAPALSISTNYEDNTFVLAKDETKDITVNLKSYIESGISYKMFYEMITGNSTFKVTSNTQFKNNVVEGNMDLTTSFTLTFQNTGTEEATIKLGVQGDIKNSNIELENGFEIEINSNLNETLKNKLIASFEQNTSNSCRTLSVLDDESTYLSGNKDCINFNYVWYSGRLWRIVAINPDGTLKMITEEKVKEVDSTSIDDFYDKTKKNDPTYLGSDIYKYLNNDFLNTLKEHKNIVVEDSTWNNGNEAKGITNNIVNKLPKTTIINNSTIGKNTPVGLLNSYEYYLSYKNTMSKSATHDNTSSYLNNEDAWWLINGGHVTFDITFNKAGTNHVIFNYGKEGNLGVRPVINILESVKPVSGKGTRDNPYYLLAKHTVKFDTDGGSNISDQIIDYDEKATKPNDPKKEGYTFATWSLNGSTYDFDTVVADNITLKATWTINKYTVKFNTNGGNSISDQTIDYKGKVTKPNDPEKEGYKFLGWEYNGNTYDFDTEITSDITLTAIWKKYYTVSFDLDDGTGSINSVNVVEGNKLEKPSDPEKEGYIFTGWTLNGNIYDFDTKITSDITLKATWKKCYTVSFDLDGGEGLNNIKVAEGSKLEKPSDPVKVGYTFMGWTLNGSAYDFDTILTSNITLTATWKKNIYTIEAVRVDALSLDYKLFVYKDGVQTSFTEIRNSKGSVLCSYSNPVVSTSDIKDVTTLNVIIDGNSIEATLTIKES